MGGNRQHMRCLMGKWGFERCAGALGCGDTGVGAMPKAAWYIRVGIYNARPLPDSSRHQEPPAEPAARVRQDAKPTYEERTQMPEEKKPS